MLRILAYLTLAASTLLKAEPPLPRQIIPEIQNLKSGELVPAPLLQTYDSKIIGENMVYRLYLQYERDVPAPTGSVPVNIINDATIAIRFEERDLETILKDGFLNFHQTRKTLGTPATGFRVAAERRLIDLRFENAIEWEGGFLANSKSVLHYLRPKYAAVSLKTQFPLGWKTTDTSQYGTLIAVLKDEVKLRSTLTTSDSLGIFSFNYDPFETPEVPVERRRKKQSTFYHDSVFVQQGSYFEAQIFGALDLGDVAYFALPNEGGSKETIKRLSLSGMRVKTYFGMREFEREKLLTVSPFASHRGCGELLESLNLRRRMLNSY